MKTSIIIQSKLAVLIFAFILSFTSCAQKTETSSKTTTTAVAKPSQDIHEAIITNNYEVVMQHIKAGTDINLKEPMGGSTPLMNAVTFNKPKIVAALIKAKADMSIQNNDGSTVLHTAAFFGRLDMVQQLIDAGADKTIQNNFGMTPRDLVLAEFAQMKPVYEMIALQLQPMGLVIDLAEVQKARPVVAMMLQ